MTKLSGSFTNFGGLRLPPVKNEPMQDYAPGSTERKLQQGSLKRIKSECPDIPCIINGEEIRTGECVEQTMPSDHKHVVCTYHKATSSVIEQAIFSAMNAKKEWEAMPTEDRLAIFTKASWLLSKIHRYDLNAATMLGQG
eukprot:224458_1